MAFNSIPEILEDIRRGRKVIMVDDEDRENEGDIIMAASHVRPEDINFMVREGRGLVCLALTEQRCRQLGLQPMVEHNHSSQHTNFTVSIEAAEGVTTGISAYDRARTIQAAVKADARAADVVSPGHIFPLMARPGGVLTRAGHTEASVDLAGLAGLEPAGVLVEVLKEDGSMARRPELEAFARRHELKIGSIADLIRYRLETEKTVERVHEQDVVTVAGSFHLIVWRDLLRHDLHFSLSRGDIADGAPVLTRVHVRDTLTDVLHIAPGDGSFTASAALRRIAEAGRGVLVLLSSEEAPERILARLNDPDHGAEDGKTRWRRLGLGAQILADLGVHQLHLLGTQRRLVGLAGFGLEVTGWTEGDA